MAITVYDSKIFTFENGVTARANSSISFDKRYWEVTIDAGNYWDSIYFVIGVGTSAILSRQLFSETLYGWGIDSEGRTRHAGLEGEQVIPQYRNATIYGKITIGVALDLDNGYLWAYIADEWGKYDSIGDPVTGTNPHISGIIGTVYPMVSMQLFGEDVSANTIITANFGKTPFEFDMPFGYNIIEGPSSSSSSSVSSSSSSCMSSSSSCSSSCESSSSESSSSSSFSISSSRSLSSSSSQSISSSSCSSSLSCLIPSTYPQMTNFNAQVESYVNEENEYPQIKNVGIQIESYINEDDECPQIRNISIQVETAS